MPKDSILPSHTTLSSDSSLARMNSDPTMSRPGSVLLVEDGDMLSSGTVGPLRENQSDVPGVVDWGRYQMVNTDKKYDIGKAPLARGFLFYFGKAATGVANISAYGIEKYKAEYSDRAWDKVPNAKGRYADALLRHLEAHLRGEVNDPESGKPHVDHMAWNALALSELEKMENDK